MCGGHSLFGICLGMKLSLPHWPQPSWLCVECPSGAGHVTVGLVWTLALVESCRCSRGSGTSTPGLQTCPCGVRNEAGTGHCGGNSFPSQPGTVVAEGLWCPPVVWRLGYEGCVLEDVAHVKAGPTSRTRLVCVVGVSQVSDRGWISLLDGQ